MVSTIFAILLSPVLFLVYGIALSIFIKNRSLLGESTGLVMAGLMFLCIPLVLSMFGFVLFMPALISVASLRVAMLLIGFAVTTFVTDKKES